MSSSVPHASVVVPTLDRPASLARCLGALREQAHLEPLELVVVDAASKHAPSTVAEVVDAIPGARLVRCELQSPAAARNAGIEHARGRYVLFTDDDSVPAPDWAARVLARLRGGARVVMGKTINGRPESSLAAATQTILDYVTDPSNVRRAKRFATTNNLGCTRELALMVPFDERFQFASEDRDWSARVAMLGYDLAYAPDAVVVHDPEVSAATFLRKHAAYGRGVYQFGKKHGTESWAERPSFYVGLLREGFAKGLRTGAAVGLAQAATGVGFAAAALTDLAARLEEAGASVEVK